MPVNRMDPEGYPPPRRFGWTHINLRRAYQSIYTPGAATNFATHGLFNSSSGDRVLVVRGFTASGTTAASSPKVAYQRGILGAHLGSEFPMWTNRPQSAGQHCYLDTATPITNQVLLAGAVTFAQYDVAGPPLFILEPGWTALFQANAVALTVFAGWLWEELRIDDDALGAIGERG